MHLSDTHCYDDEDDNDGGDDDGDNDDDGGGDDGGYDYDDGGGDDVEDANNDIARPHIASRAFLSVCGAVWCAWNATIATIAICFLQSKQRNVAHPVVLVVVVLLMMMMMMKPF